MILFASDWHLGHERIIELCGRPFPDAATMNNCLIDRCNSMAGPADTLIFLGDAVMGQLADNLPLIGQVYAKLWLIPGNHDRVSWWYEGYRDLAPEKRVAKIAEWRTRYEDVGFEIHDTARTIDVHGFTLRMSHFPYTDEDYGEGRFPSEAYPEDEGRWLVHGHVHGGWRQRGKQINVGADAWNGFPVPADTIAAMVQAGPAMLDSKPWTP